MEPTLLFEDGDVLVITKPAGLIVHSDGRTHEPSVVDWVLAHYPHMRGVGEPWVSPQGEVIDRPGIVHRLDRTTSGVLVLAKTAEAYAALKKQFHDRTVQKEYRALVYGHPKPEQGVIEQEIVRVKSVPPRWAARFVREGQKSRAAITLWSVLRRGMSPEGERVSVLKLVPKTGRTHQLRVHLQALGYPIIADHLYAAARPKLLGLTRPALHAEQITIDLPHGGRRTFQAPLPDDLRVAEALIT
jgi:23S rRNA pseudouridine1911/1915/1917 synthase